MTDHWKCPHCGSSNEKTPRQGPIVKHLDGNQILYHTSHPDYCPQCGGVVSGADIVTGRYDHNWADLKAGLKQGVMGLACVGWIIGAFWVFPFTFNQGWIFGIISVLIWLSPLVWALRSR
jgi:hypothetical protein